MTYSAAAQDGPNRLLHKQAYVISRAQAIAHGLTPDALKYRIRPGGPWQRMLPGVYLAVTGTPTATQHETAAILYAGQDSVITGLAALRRHRLRVPESSHITVLVPAGRSRASKDFVRVLSTTRMPERVCFAGPVVFTLAARAVVDATRELRSFWDVRALIADAVQQGHCRIDTLAGELARGPVRSSAWFRQALSEVASGVRSAAEADLRNLIIRAGLPVPIFNARLYLDGKLVAIADAWWAAARVAVEVDSRQWHLSPDDHEQTLRRSAALAALGIVVLHFTPGQIRRESAQVVAAIRAAVAGDGRRGGPVIHVLPADR